MKKFFVLAALACLPMSFAHGEAAPNKPAPAFEVKDANGKTHTLAEGKGKWVVLEWTNKDCPYVKKHYGSGNMQKLQKKYTEKGVEWLSVISSAKGEQGNLSPEEALKVASTNNSAATAILLDENGTMGKAYGAKTTPHMFVINPEGKVVYAGAIDNNDSDKPEVIAKSTNLVAAALDEGMAGKTITQNYQKPYGCGVKYKK